jgi:hypothetical protein
MVYSSNSAAAALAQDEQAAQEYHPEKTRSLASQTAFVVAGIRIQ